jgi:methylated-DNA-protein-cysteine methyltransferase-like protein
MADEFVTRVVAVMQKIPRGKVATYGLIAAMAGNPRGARQVVRVLHSSATKLKLPWYRVINAGGRISLPPGAGYELQKALLEKEGVTFTPDGKVDFKKYLWKSSEHVSAGSKKKPTGVRKS